MLKMKISGKIIKIRHPEAGNYLIVKPDGVKR